MTRHPTPPANPAQPSDPSWARPLYEQQIALLGELAEAGMAVARVIADQSKDVEDVKHLTALANAYARVARAVRMTILLQSKLIQQLQDWDRQAAGPAAQSEHEALVDQRRAMRDREDAEHIERLVMDGGEPRDRDDIYALVRSRPVSELIPMICQDLGLDPDWLRLTQDALAQKAAARTAGSPFAAPAVQEPRTREPGKRPLGRPPDSH